MKLNKEQISALANKVFVELNKPYREKYNELYNQSGYLKIPITVTLNIEDKKYIKEYKELSNKINNAYKFAGLGDVITQSVNTIESNIKQRNIQKETQKIHKLLDILKTKVTKQDIEYEIILSTIEGDFTAEELITKLIKKFK